ncbi:MAG: gamma-glutamylcyclotransferase [Campylobacterales bacterium]|nr:gamma-glutamylcyclotransferase [Campylobacterales bacterium]
MVNVFTYGSLMFPQVWSRVVQGEYESIRGTLHGFRRRCLKKETYPVAFEGAPSERVLGEVYLNVNEDDIKRLDAFEGEYYLRKTEDIVLDNGKIVRASVYVLKSDFYQLVDDNPWDVEHFKLVGIQRFLEQYQGFLSVS